MELGLPCEIGDYTDFYVGIHHATAVGKQFRPDNPLLPNYKWVPIGYHGRASTICASGHAFRRPRGQIKAPDAAQRRASAPTRRLDYELELGIFIGRPNALGEPVRDRRTPRSTCSASRCSTTGARATSRRWEYQPLGPFLSKNFASTVSPWIVTLEALAPFRSAFARARRATRRRCRTSTRPPTASAAPSTSSSRSGCRRRAMRAGRRMRGDVISRSNFADAAYWTVAQLVAHHTVNGCNLRSGDLFGSGTLSGPAAGAGAARCWS